MKNPNWIENLEALEAMTLKLVEEEKREDTERFQNTILDIVKRVASIKTNEEDKYVNNDPEIEALIIKAMEIKDLL